LSIWVYKKPWFTRNLSETQEKLIESKWLLGSCFLIRSSELRNASIWGIGPIILPIIKWDRHRSCEDPFSKYLHTIAEKMLKLAGLYSVNWGWLRLIRTLR
jgi:hypothetical protein